MLFLLLFGVCGAIIIDYYCVAEFESLNGEETRI